MKAMVLCSVGLIVGLAGCGPIQRAQHAAYARERMAQGNVEMAASVEKRKASVIKARVESATCTNDAQRRAFIDVGYPYTDLQSSLSAARLRVAAQIDAGQIGEVEAQARMMDTIAQV